MLKPKGPGPHTYTDAMPGAKPVPCEIVEQDGELVAIFPRNEEEEGAEIRVLDMQGDFQPA